VVERRFVLLIQKELGAEAPFEVLQVACTPSSPIGRGIVLEPVELQRRQYLLMMVEDNARSLVRHNGETAWPITLLRVKDEIRTGAGTFYVSFSRGRTVFPPEKQHLGAPCPLCTVPFAEDTLLYACRCGAVLHCEDESKSEDQRLECARMLSTCPKCHQPIDFNTGLEWEPEP